MGAPSFGFIVVNPDGNAARRGSISWNGWYKVVLTVLMVGMSVVVADLWAGLVVGLSMCSVWLVAAVIQRRSADKT